MFRDWCICLLVLAVYSCAVAGQYTLTGPTSAPEGSTVTFTCTTSPVQIGVIWRETSGSNTNDYVYFYNSAGRCQRSTGAPPSDYTFDCNSTGVFSLSFPADYSRHSGAVFKCRSSVAEGGESNNITLGVTVPLTSVTLLNATNSPLTVVQGTDVTLVCETNPTDPESTISWRRDGQSVSQGVTSSTRQKTEGVVTVSVWSQGVQWTDRGAYSCEALNSGVTRTSRDLTLAVQVPVSSVNLSNITSNNQQVPVNQDSSLVLTCQTSPAYPAPTVTWYVRSSLTSSGVDSRTDTQTSGQIVTVSTMTRTMRKNNDQDTFYCQAENINGEAGQSKTARANVFYGPDANMTNLTKPAVITERNNVNLTCSTLTPVNPEVDFIWSWGDNTAIAAGLGNKQGAARGTWSQTLTVRAVRDSNRQEIRCDVINTQTSRMERVVVDLDVSFGPDSGEVQVSKSSTAVELEPLSFTCSTTNNVKPGVTFTWTVDGSEVTSGTGQKQGSSGGNWSQTLTLTPNRNQSSVGCTVINTVIARKESGSVVLDVNYPPDISLSPVEGPQNTDLTLTCTATGNPSNYMFEDFRQYWGDQLIQRRGGTQTGDRYSLDLPQVTYQDSGVYVCTVGNNVKQPSHKNTIVTVQASPVYTKDVDTTEPVGAEVGQTARLVQYGYSSPNFTSVSWHFNTTNTNTSRLSTDSSSVSSSLVHLDVYGTQVEVAGFKLVYTVTNFQQEHVGLYTVTVCNRVGCAESSLKLIGSGPPDAPTELLMWSDGPNSVRLSWKAGSNGRAKQHFRVQYKKEADPWTKTQGLYEDNGEPFIQGHIQGLKPETLYFVRVQSINKYGNSSFTDVERVLTKATTPAIQTGPTAPSTGTQERNDLDCSGGRMRIHVPQTLLPTHIVTLRDPSCKVASNGSHLLADVGVNECGTTVSFTNDSVIFTNELVATALSGTTAPTIIDYGMNMKDQRVKISCIYPRENRVDFSYVPVMKEAHFYERQYGKLSFDVSQYSDEQFSHAIPHNGLPIGVTLNTELFIDISLRHASHKGVGIMVDSCIATPTSSPADPLWYTVIKDGCPAQQDVRTFASPDVDEFRFSFLVFRFTQAPLQKAGPNLPPTSMVFIHCQVSACPSQNCTNTCNPAGSHRVRREAELENSHLVSAGPFYLKSEEERGGYTGGVVAASVSMAVVATLVAIVALVAWRRSVNKLSKHQTLDEAS